MTSPGVRTAALAARGFVYVATGSGYLEEARRSAQSLRRHHPTIPICLITDRTDGEGAPFDLVLSRTDVEQRPIDKLLAWHAPFERTVFLDTDTCIRGDLTALFEVLDRFDLAALQDLNRGWDYPLPGVPECFTEFNTGVLAFRPSPAVETFFRRWRCEYDELQRRQPELNVQADQPAFRRTLYHSDLRIAPLPSEFNFLTHFPNAALWKIRVLHGRGDLESVAATVDQELGARAYVPDVGVITGFHGRRRWLGATLRIMQRMARLLFVPPPDRSASNPRRWWRQDGHDSRDRARLP